MISRNGTNGLFGHLVRLALIVAFFAPVAIADTIYVDVDNNSGKEDGSVEHPYNTITEAATAAKAGDTVQVAEGTYYERNIKTANSGSPGNPVLLDKVTPYSPPRIEKSWNVM